MKTAIEMIEAELVRRINDGTYESKDTAHLWRATKRAYESALKLLRAYKPEEKRLIQDAFDDGRANWEQEKRDYEDGVNYFEETYYKPDYDLPMNWEPNYNGESAEERREKQAKEQKLK